MTLKRILILAFLSFITFFVNAQTGLNFQGVARSSNNTILASQPISLRLSILQGSANGTVEYVEVRKVNTNAQGLFSVVIGDEEATNTIGSISSINWKNTPKFLKIEMDATAGNNFTLVGTTQFQYVAYAQFAKSVDAENIAGIIPVEKGGTGVASISALKTTLAIDKSNIGLSKVDNTADSSKPISVLTQAALDTKVSTETFSSSIALKAPIESPTFTGKVNGISKSMIGLSNVDNTSDLLKPISTATQLELDTKVSTSTYSNTIVTKENISNKSSATDLGGLNPSDILYPTQKAVKAYVTANNSSGGIADGGITTNKLADAAVNFQKFQTIPSFTILGNTSTSTTSIQAINTTGVDNVVLSTNPIIQSPTLITPTIGDATATSINNVTINALNGNASLTVRGDVTLRGMNNGDDAPNQRYENILTDIVSLTANQPIDGQKTFQNNIVMGNIGGISNTSSPTTIQFNNGSKIGDIQNINEGVPDNVGSIDLYAPDGAKWVQLNYANRNYISLGTNFIGFWLNENEWDFDENGFTILPGELFTKGSIYFSDDGITNLPNASIESNGPLLKLKARMYTEEENQNETPFGIELNYADKSKIEIDDQIIESYVRYINGLNDWESNVKISQSDMTYMFFNHNNRVGNYWTFDGLTAKTILPGQLEIMGDLKLGEVLYSNEGGASGDVLTYDGNGHAIWQAPITSNGNVSGISSLNNLNDALQSFAIGTDGNDFNISSASGIHTFNLPDASTLNRGLLTSDDFTRFNNKQDALDYATDSRGGYLRSVDFNIFNGKQDALVNPITGTGTNGQLSFFNSTNSIASSSNLFWDENNKRLGIRNTSPSYPFEINQEADNYGFMINAPSGNTWGSAIGFKSNIGIGTATRSGLFQLDGDGAMVFRTYQNQMYFDDFDVNGVINFRIGAEYGSKKGMSINKDGNLNLDGSVRALSDIATSGSIKTGIFVQDLQNNIVYTPTAIITSAGDMTTPGSITAQNFNTSSDFRLKKYIKPLENSLSILKQLNPVAYQKKLSLESNDYPIKENGFIAQELEKVLPNLVHASEDKDHLLSVNYTAIIPILTKGIQEQQEEIENLKKELQELKKLIQTKHKLK